MSGAGTADRGMGSGMRGISLFSGVGGMDLGLERSGLVTRTIAQVEFDPWCRAVLEYRWPDARRFDDVRRFGREDYWKLGAGGRVVVSGGFPCTDLSSAGRGAGLAGEKSGLWREQLRIVEEVRPEAVVVENVASGKRRFLPFVRRDLHLLGYDTAALAVSAADVGAPHERRRVFVIAWRVEGVGRARTLRDAPHADGEPLRDGPERVPGGWAGAVRTEGLAGSAVGSPMGDAHGQRELEPGGPARPEERRWLADSSGRGAEPGLGGGPGGPAAGMDRRGQGTAWGEDWEEGLARTLPRLPKGAASRVEGRHRRRRLVALGNICVPQCAEVAGRVLKDVLDGVLVAE